MKKLIMTSSDTVRKYY